MLNKQHSILGLIPLFQVLEEVGIDPQTLLHRHNIDLTSLSGSALIDEAVQFAITQDAIKLVDDPLFALNVGSKSTFASYGAFALLILTANTFREALQTSVQFQRLSLLVTQLSIHFEQDHFELRYTLPKTSETMSHFIADSGFAGTYNFMSEMLGYPFRSSMTGGVARPEPSSKLLTAYRKITDIPLQFNQAFSWFRLPNSLLNSKLKHGNVLAHKLYRVQAQESLRLRFSYNMDFPSQVKQLIVGYERNFPNAEQVAKSFNISVRTLRRKLDASGSSYRHIVDEQRKERAITMLTAENYSVQLLAEKLGYTESASFLRAFKRWTGTTPKKYLKNNT